MSVFTRANSLYPIINHREKGRSYEIAGPLIGKGILSNGGEPWKQHRRLVELGFRLENLKFSARRINDVLDRLVSRWKSNPAEFQDNYFDMRGELLRYVSTIVHQRRYLDL